MRKIVASILILVLALVPTAVLATDINVSADSTSVKTGDTVTVTVTVSASNIAVADGVFTYDPSLLTYISSNGGASDGYINLVSVQKGGSDSLTTVIKFTAIGEGEAVIDVSMESVLDYNGNSLDNAQAGVSISVASSGTDSGEQTDGDSTPPVDYSQTGVAAENVMGTDEQMYIWRSLRNVSLPSGYVDRQVTYNDEFVGGAAIPDSEDIILLYLSEASGENASYYIYDGQKDLFFPYITVTSISAYFTLIWPEENMAIPGYEETMLELGGKDVPAWIHPESDGTVYLVYVRNSSGEVGFYLYNVEDRSLQRYKAFVDVETEPEPTVLETLEPTVAPVISQTDENEPGKTSPEFLVAFIAVCAVLAAAAIIFAVLYAKSSARLRRTVKSSAVEAEEIQETDKTVEPAQKQEAPRRQNKDKKPRKVKKPEKKGLNIKDAEL